MSEKSVTREAVKIISLCLAWYTFSATNNVLGKKIFMVFPYPMTLSMTHHLALNALLGPALALLSVEPSPYISTRFYVRRLVPLAMGKVLASFTSMLSILKVPVSYAHTVKAVMPIFTVILSTLILKERHSLKVYLSLIPIVVGVFIATVTELSFDSVGLVAALIATLSFALQNIYSKKCMRDTKIHHLRLLLVLSQLACVMLLPFWMYTDLWDIVSNLHKVQDLGWLAISLPLSGVLVFSQNIVAFSIISAVSPLSYSVANSTKRIVIITVSLFLLKNPVTVGNVCGMTLAISGVGYYNKVKIDEKRRKIPVLPVPTGISTKGMEYSSIVPASGDTGLLNTGQSNLVLSQRFPTTHEDSDQVMAPMRII